MRASYSDRLGGLLLVLLALVAAPAAGQEVPRFELAPFAGASIRDSGAGLRLAEDVRAYGIRLEVPRSGYHPFLELSGFERPDLDCLPGLACNDGGWVIRLGALAYLSPAPYRSGVQPRLMAGIGAGFSEETTVSHFLGLGFDWRFGRVLATMLDVRWEQLPGIGILMVNAGLKIAVPYPRRDAEEGT